MDSGSTPLESFVPLNPVRAAPLHRAKSHPDAESLREELLHFPGKHLHPEVEVDDGP